MANTPRNGRAQPSRAAQGGRNMRTCSTRVTMNMSHQCPWSQEGPVSRCTQHSTASRAAGIAPLCSARGGPTRSIHCVQGCAHGRQHVIKLPETVQKKLQRSLGLFSLEETERQPHHGYSFITREQERQAPNSSL